MSGVMLDEHRQVVGHLLEVGLIDDPVAMTVEAMAGGVSNDVFAIVGPGIDVVMKRALPQLRVEADWFADVARLQTEGAALRLADHLIPGSAPRVLEMSAGWLVLERAPHGWRDWRDTLFAGAIDPAVAAHLGRYLGRWQEATNGRPEGTAPFLDRGAFTQLRVDPFYRVAALAHPDLASRFDVVIERMLSRQDCLVHGDFTPKNVLHDPADGAAAPWVIDWEVAHIGDPAFDPAMLLTHLLLKSIHRPSAQAALRGSAVAFLREYVASGGLVNDDAGLVEQVGCLLLARADGKSPATYLTTSEREVVRRVGRGALRTPTGSTLDLWKEL